MSMSEKLKRVINIALPDEASYQEFLGLFGGAAGSVIAAGEFTTAGGDVTEEIAVVGALATDVVTVTMKSVGAVPVTIVTSIAAADQVVVTLSADPSTDHVLSYMVFRNA